jgi:hypothetical protein
MECFACQRQYGMILAKDSGRSVDELIHWSSCLSEGRETPCWEARREVSMYITSSECFFVIILTAAFIGLWRGWIREVITTAILLGVILFLLLGGSDVIYRFIFVNLVDAFKALFGGGVSASNSNPAAPPSTQSDFVFTLLTFGGLTTVGYLVGHRAGKPPTSATHRLTGIIPGAVNGAAIVFYATRNIIPNVDVNVQSPDASTVGSYLPVIFGIALLAVIVILIALSSKSKAKK